MGYNIYKCVCCLCYKYGARLKICIQDYSILPKQLKALQPIFEENNTYSYLHICEICVMKQQKSIKCDSKTYFQDIYYSMQDSLHIEDTNCQCEYCKAKFGNLPLLAEVIDIFENKTTQYLETKTETLGENEMKSDETPLNYSIRKTLETSQEIQPSTSRETTTHRKIMSCEHCGKSFTHKGDMNKHLRKHTGEQPFSCHICNRKFAHTSNLARHLKVHSGDKPFHCEKCNKSFSRKDKLIVHKKTKLCMKNASSS